MIFERAKGRSMMDLGCLEAKVLIHEVDFNPRTVKFGPFETHLIFPHQLRPWTNE